MSCSDWFLLLWVCPKRRPAPLPQLRVFKAWLGPGLGGCVVVPLPSEQTTEAHPRAAGLRSLQPASSAATWLGREGLGQEGLARGPFCLQFKRGREAPPSWSGSRETSNAVYERARFCCAGVPAGSLVSILRWLKFKG